jgi:glycosyltransferase involved in cell wall biosynthesis
VPVIDQPATRHAAGGSRTRLRVAFGLDTLDIGGTELNAVRTAERLDPSRFALTVFHIHADGPLLDRYRVIGARLVHTPIRRLHSTGYIRQGLRIRRELREWRADVFHAHDVYSNVLGVPWARIAGVGLVLASRRWTDALPRAGLRPVNTWASRCAHGVIANSAVVARRAVQEGIQPGRVVVLPNFVDEEAFEDPPEATRQRRRADYALPAGGPLIGAVGRLSRVKGYDILLRAVAEVQDVPQLHLVLIGDGPERERLKRLAIDLAIGDRVSFTGARTERWNLHQLFDISVLSSRTEGFPNTLVEAMAAARPIVATNVGGVADAIRDGETGIVVPRESVGELATALRRLLAAPERRAALGAAARAAARSAYHADSVMNRLEALYGRARNRAKEAPMRHAAAPVL